MRKIAMKVFFRWYDLWIGLYIDIKNKALYICPLPMLGIKISWGLKVKPFKIYSQEEPSEAFAIAACDVGSIYVECECGRVFYTTFDGDGIFEEGELESIREKEKVNPDKYFDWSDYSSISYTNMGGGTYVVGCPCHGLTRFEKFIWANRWRIASYFNHKAEEAKTDTELLKQVSDQTDKGRHL